MERRPRPSGDWQRAGPVGVVIRSQTRAIRIQTRAIRVQTRARRGVSPGFGVTPQVLAAWGPAASTSAPSPSCSFVLRVFASSACAPGAASSACAPGAASSAQTWVGAAGQGRPYFPREPASLRTCEFANLRVAAVARGSPRRERAERVGKQGVREWRDTTVSRALDSTVRTHYHDHSPGTDRSSGSDRVRVRMQKAE